MKKIAVALLVMLASSCATTNEMPLAPNMVRLDTEASGLLFVASAGSVTMKKAAEATLRRGYTHFRLEQAQTAQGSRFVGVSSYSSGTATVNTFGNSAYGSYSGSGFASPVYAPTASVGVTVVMFKEDEPGASGAFDAAEVLKKQGKI